MSNLLFPAMDTNAWESARRLYSYPSVWLKLADGQTFDLNDSGLKLVRDESEKNLPTGKKIEQMHLSLLLSEKFDEQMHGLASVTFWGHYSSNSGRACSKAELVLSRRPKGTGEKVDLTPVLGAVRSAIERRDVGEALECFLKVPNFGPSFASKAVAFCAPEIAGVLDKRVCKKLENISSGNGRISELSKFFKINKASSVRLRKLYETWCELCVEKSASLNSEGSHWIDFDGCVQRWRAIDVERAVFSL